MAKQSWMERVGVTPGKAILIAVLSVVLIGVLVSQLVGTDEPNEVASAAGKPAPRRPRAKVPLNRTAAATTPTASRSSWRPWEQISVEEAIQFNPLQLPAGLEIAALSAAPAQVDPAQAEKQHALALERMKVRQQLLDAGVRMIVVGPHGKSAYIGEQLVREGDVIDGFLVKTIRADGVEFVDTHAQ
jgi:hypothetical protein